MNTQQRHYLIVGPSWIGDMVMAQSLFITLKQQYPNCIIDVLAPAWSLSVIRRMPEINVAIDMGVLHGEFSLLKRRRLGIELRYKAYTHAITIPRSWKSALIPYFAKIPVRTGYKGEMRYGLLNDIRTLDKKILKQTVQRYVAHSSSGNVTVAPDTPFPKLTVYPDNQKILLERFNLSLDSPVACMMPGAEYGPAKQWPLTHFAGLAKRLLENGWQVWILGSAKDSAAGDGIIELMPDDSAKEKVINLCGKTELVDTVDLLALAKSVISNDSGLMHVAAAVGVNVNVIYGSSTPDYTPPLADVNKAKIFYLSLSCSPCFKRVCPLGHTDCLNNIKDEDVYNSIA